ncbi:MAG: hypothetical protein AAAB14_11450, partial [Ensifer adhaerens]
LQLVKRIAHQLPSHVLSRGRSLEVTIFFGRVNVISSNCLARSAGRKPRTLFSISSGPKEKAEVAVALPPFCR